MVLTDNNGGGLSAADVAAVMGSNGYGNGWGLGGDGAWWLIVLLLALGNGGWGFGGGFGGFGGMMGMGMADGMMLYPWMNQADITTSGFQNQATNFAINSLQNSVTSGFGDVQLGIAGINQNICQTGNGITAAVTNGFNAAEVANNSRQIANMQQQFALQQQLAQCCCDNRLATANLNATILSENCADRQALSDGVRDLLVNQTANTQRLVDTTTAAVQGVYDKLCQLELDAKNDKIADLQRQLTAAELSASQGAQTARILADNAAQTVALEQYLNPTPIPAYNVPNPNCCNYGYNTGCCGN